MRTWWRERLTDRRANVAADAARAVAARHTPEDVTEARRRCRDARDWLTHAEAFAPALLAGYGWLSSGEVSVSLALLTMTEGNIQADAGDVKGSIETFGDAIARLRTKADTPNDLPPPSPGVDPDIWRWLGAGIDSHEQSMLGRLLFNQGNSYLRLERYADAHRNYEECKGIFTGLGEEASLKRVEQADLLAQSRRQTQPDDRKGLVTRRGTTLSRRNGPWLADRTANPASSTRRRSCPRTGCCSAS